MQSEDIPIGNQGTKRINLRRSDTARRDFTVRLTSPELK